MNEEVSNQVIRIVFSSQGSGRLEVSGRRSAFFTRRTRSSKRKEKGRKPEQSGTTTRARCSPHSRTRSKEINGTSRRPMGERTLMRKSCKVRTMMIKLRRRRARDGGETRVGGEANNNENERSTIETLVVEHTESSPCLAKGESLSVLPQETESS